MTTASPTLIGRPASSERRDPSLPHDILLRHQEKRTSGEAKSVKGKHADVERSSQQVKKTGGGGNCLRGRERGPEGEGMSGL